MQLFTRPKSALSNHFTIHRTDTVTDVVLAIKQQFPRIRCYNWELAKPFLDDFMNFRRVITDSDTGASKFRYRRHGSKPDDGVHALNYAFIVARLILGEPLVQDPALRVEVYDLIRKLTVAGTAQATMRQPGSMIISG